MRKINLAAALGLVSSFVLLSCQTQAPATGSAQPDTPVQIAGPPLPTASPTLLAASHPGESVYEQFCAACHDNTEATRAPSRDNFKGMNFQFVNFSLTKGRMMEVGSMLTADQRVEVISYIIGRDLAPAVDWAPKMMCDSARIAVDLGEPEAAISTHFGFDAHNTRKLTAKQTGLTTSQISNLELAWGIAFPDSTIMRGQGAIVGKNLFYPAADAGKVYAFDLSDPMKPCVQWVYAVPGGVPLRSSVAYGVLADGSPLLVVSGLDAIVHGIDPRTGVALWTKSVAYSPFSMTTGTPSIVKDSVIVPVAQFEITVASSNSTDCCTSHGHIVALDPKTGEQQWLYETMEDAVPQRDRGDGKPLKGPSGAPIWNSPAIDERRGLIFFGTGESNSPPAHRNTNAIIAVDLKTGTEKWSFQATPDDIYNSGCGLYPKPELLNCVTAPETVYRDVDFGASVIVGKLSNGQDLIFAGQKSGSVWALDPDTGKVAWRKALGTGGALGGIHWGIAYDADTVYAPISQVGVPIPGEWDGDPTIKPGLYALDAMTGAIKWQFNPEPPPGAPTGPRGWRGGAFSTAPAIVDDAVVAAALDGTIFIINKNTGQLLWSYNTAQEYEGINGVKGKGGSIDANSITAMNGVLLVNSGYSLFGQAGGNMLLAFKPRSQVSTRGAPTP